MTCLPSLLFATTNHIERLDPALSRPGRMDVWVNFKNATQWQAEGIFKCFFPFKPNQNSSVSTTMDPMDPRSQQNLAESKRKRSTHTIPLLSEDELSELAKQFSAAIPEGELSVRKAFGPFGWLANSNFFHRSQPYRDTFSRTRLDLAKLSRKLRHGEYLCIVDHRDLVMV